MRVNSSVEAALHITVLIATAPPGRELAAVDVAAFHDLSANTLAKVLKQLRAAGVLVGSTGRSGGYRLARPANEISVLDVVSALDGVEPVFHCKEIRRDGPCATTSGYSPRCSIARVMDSATAAWRNTLDAVSIEDLLSQISKEAPALSLKKTSAWIDEHAR